MFFGRIKIALIAIGTFVAAIFVAFLRGRSVEAAADEHEELENYVETRTRMDEAEADLDDDPDILRDWLRERGQR